MLFTFALPAIFGQGGQDLSGLSLEQLLNVKVTSASLHEQSLKDAPASVTVITADEIRKFGYRTLADALSYVRGFFFTNDHTYNELGIRGFSLPGDYDTHLILMIDGHNIADNIFEEANWYGNDFPVDIDLVDRIEVVRGPSSALYGSSGLLATINVITRRPANSSGTDVRLETSSSGDRKVAVSTAVALPRGANLLFSTSAFNNAGAHALYFSDLDSAPTGLGPAINMDGEKGFHAFADLTWGNWELLAIEGDRVKQQPVSWAPTIFNDRGTRIEDSGGFVDLSYRKAFDDARQLNWDISYNVNWFHGIYHYAYDSNGVVGDNREIDLGEWIDSRLTYQPPGFWGGQLTLGSELKIDLRSQMHLFNIEPQNEEFLNFNRCDRYLGIFAQQEWTFGTHWELSLGGRFDWSWLRHDALSPRASLIYKPSSKSSIKLLADRGFRNPNTYEMFFEDHGLIQQANPGLRPEYINSFEVDLDHQFTKRLRAEADVYHYGVTGLIQETFLPNGLIQFVNRGSVRAAGASFELDAVLPREIELRSSIEIQRAVLANGTVLPNSPGQVGKLRASMPLWRNRLTVGVGIQALGQRQTYDGVALPWYILPEVVISTKPMAGGFQLSAGVKNLSNSFYLDPIGFSAAIDSVIGAGRSYYLSLSWHGGETRPDSAKENRLRASAR